MNLRLRRFYVVIMVSLTVLMTIAIVGAQEFITLANDRGVQKTSFARGEGIEVLITLPYNANVEVWLHNPAGTAGPSPTNFIPATPVTANIQTVLGPRLLDERAPCGKYRLEIIIRNPPTSPQPKTEYRFFDYAINEPPCAPTTITTTDNTTLFVIGGVSAIAIAAIVSALLLTRWRAPPPKERAVIPPPVPPPPSPPTTPSAPPKPQHRRAPVVRGTERDEERP